MKNTISRFSLGVILLSFLLVSCVSSRQKPPSGLANTPNPTEKSQVETAQALLIGTQQALATTTPTTVPTITFTPTPKISLSGTSLIVREDKTTEFIDYKAGIRLTIPAGWLAVRIDEEEYYKAFTTSAVLDNQEIYKRLNQIQTHDGNFFRLNAIDIRPGHIVNGMIADISVVFQPDDVRTLEEWERAERKRVSPYSGFKFISSSYQETSNGTRVLLIEESWNWTQGGSVYYRGVFFSLPTGTVVLDFQTNIDFKDTVLPDFEQVVNSLVLIGQ